MSQERSTSVYTAGKNHLQNHLESVFQSQEMSIEEIRGHSQRFQKMAVRAHQEKEGPYADARFALGAQNGVRAWEQNRIQERERPQRAQNGNELSPGLQQAFERAGHRSQSRER